MIDRRDNNLPTIDYAAPMPKRRKGSSDWGHVMAGSSAFVSLSPWVVWVWCKLLESGQRNHDSSGVLCFATLGSFAAAFLLVLWWSMEVREGTVLAWLTLAATIGWWIWGARACFAGFGPCIT